MDNYYGSVKPFGNSLVTDIIAGKMALKYACNQTVTFTLYNSAIKKRGD
jgi:hypothetical protein